jgi:phosphate transport system permease protein
MRYYDEEIIGMEAARRQGVVEDASPSHPVRPRRLQSWRWWRDRVAGAGMGLAALASGMLVVVIGGLLLVRAWPILSTRPLDTLIFSDAWRPTAGEFGFWPFIVGSIAVTLVAMVLAVPPALFSAVYLAEYAQARAAIKPLIDLLASIPSVVYGLWGILCIVPLVRDHLGPWIGGTLGRVIPFFANDNSTGYGLFAGGIVLAIMVFPIIVSVAEEVIRGVPQGMREASLALGATEWETAKHVVLRKAMPGVIAAVVMGFSRAFGETLAVVMVIGNVAQSPDSLFDPVYPLTALIANNYGEMMSIPLYDAALMTAALILLVVVLAFNVLARLALARVKQDAAV